MAKGKVLKEFKEFISKGNVVDMAVGVVIGGAFGKIVTGLVTDIINPFIGIFIKDGGLDGIKTVIHEAVLDEAGNVTTEEVAILWGQWLQTIIDFLIVALCIFFIVKVFNGAKKKASDVKKRNEPAAAPEVPAAPTTKKCPYCCSEIAIEATRCPHCTSELPAEDKE